MARCSVLRATNDAHSQLKATQDDAGFVDKLHNYELLVLSVLSPHAAGITMRAKHRRLKANM